MHEGVVKVKRKNRRRTGAVSGGKLHCRRWMRMRKRTGKECRRVGSRQSFILDQSIVGGGRKEEREGV